MDYDDEEIIEFAKKLLNDENESKIIDAYILISYKYIEQEKFKEGLICAQEAKNIQTNPTTLNAVAKAYFFLEEIEEAKKYYEASLIAPENVDPETKFQACNGIADCYQKKGNQELAIEEYLKMALKVDVVAKEILNSIKEKEEEKKLETIIQNENQKEEYNNLALKTKYVGIMYQILTATVKLTYLLEGTNSQNQFFENYQKINQTIKQIKESKI